MTTRFLDKSDEKILGPRNISPNLRFSVTNFFFARETTKSSANFAKFHGPNPNRGPREPVKFSNFSDSAAFAERCGAMCYRVIVHTANWLFAISVPKSRYGSPNFANFAIFEFFVKFNA